MGKMIKQYTLRNAEYIKLIVNQTTKHTIDLLHNVFKTRFTIYPKLSQIESEKCTILQKYKMNLMFFTNTIYQKY